eukprot:5389063-Pyramimonas_sp.AAC.1
MCRTPLCLARALRHSLPRGGDLQRGVGSTPHWGEFGFNRIPSRALRPCHPRPADAQRSSTQAK